MQALITTLYIEKFGVRADWTNASSPVQQLGEFGDWISTQYQVANFQHQPKEALRKIIIDCLQYGGEVDLEVVADAVDDAEWEPTE